MLSLCNQPTRQRLHVLNRNLPPSGRAISWFYCGDSIASKLALCKSWMLLFGSSMWCCQQLRAHALPWPC
jgi:hypothetical protein